MIGESAYAADLLVGGHHFLGGWHPPVHPLPALHRCGGRSGRPDPPWTARRGLRRRGLGAGASS
jgi:hypothetical protein